MIEGQDKLTKVTKLRYGMVGGGKGAFIGDVHRKAIAMDGKAELIAGCFSQTFENTLETGEFWGVPNDRLYKNYEEMIQAEAKRPDKIDFLLVVTPNDTHFPIVRAGPRTRLPRRLRQTAHDQFARDAEELGRLVAKTGLLFMRHLRLPRLSHRLSYAGHDRGRRAGRHPVHRRGISPGLAGDAP